MQGQGGVLVLMHGPSRMTVDPRIPTAPGRSTSDFHPPQAVIVCTKSAKRHVGCWTSRVGGEPDPRQEPLERRIFLAYGRQPLPLQSY